MEEVQTTTAISSNDFNSSQESRLEKLIDVPFHHKLLRALISLFNYFDIYAPRNATFYIIVAYLRSFQLIGGAFMAANPDVFSPGTLTFKTMSILSVLFHIIPVEYRNGIEYIVLLVIDMIMLIFAIYLMITAFQYQSTSKVSRMSTVILSLFMSSAPFILLPISAQYAGSIIAFYITRKGSMTMLELISVILCFILIVFYCWVIVFAYTNTLCFRASSFQSLEGSPQNKLLIMTIIITFSCSLTAYLEKYPSAAIMVLSMILYAYNSTTCFKCGTFISIKHQIILLADSILGILLCAANLFPVLHEYEWDAIFFIGFLVVYLFCIIVSSIFMKARCRKDLRLLDEIQETQDITLIKSKNKFKQIIISGFAACHPVCLDFSLFKLAINE